METFIVLSHLSSVCKEARENEGARTTGVADTAGYNSDTTITRFEKGRAWPRNPDRVVAAYALTAGVSVFDLWDEAIKRARAKGPKSVADLADWADQDAARAEKQHQKDAEK